MSVRRLDPNQPTTSFAFTPENLSWAKKTIGKYPEGKQASAVIPLLWRAQEQNAGWVSQRTIEYVADMLDMAYIRVLEVATFYTMFQLSPVGTKAHIQVCGTTPCMLRGANDLKDVCRRKIGEPHHVNADGTMSWEEVECLGACVNAPMVQVWKDTFEDLTPETLEKLIDDLQAGRKPNPGSQNGRTNSMALGGASTLTDPSLYEGQRRFARVEPPPPPPPAAVAAAPTAPAPAAAVASAPVVAVTPPPAPVSAPVAKVQESVELKKAPVVAAVSAPTIAADDDAVGKAASNTLLVPTYVDLLARQIKDKKIKAPVKTAAKVPAKVPAKTSKAAVVRTASADGSPEMLTKPRGGKGDDLELIWGVGPGLAKMLNKMGIWHFDQIASWSARQLKWVDENLKGFKGRASRDEWVPQAKKLAKGWRPDNDIGEKPTGKPGKK
jgi:NADH-quinone oxidoreductase subunit E